MGRHSKPSRVSWLPVVVGAGGAALTLHQPAPAAPAAAPVAAPVTAALAAPVLTPAPKPPVVLAAKKDMRIPPIVGAQGLTANAQTLAAYIQATYPQVRSIGGVRPCDVYGEHCRGVALDVMVDTKALGDQVSDDVLAQADRFGVQYAIWQETLEKPGGLRRWMADRGSATANHFDHVHIRVA